MKDDLIVYLNQIVFSFTVTFSVSGFSLMPEAIVLPL